MRLTNTCNTPSTSATYARLWPSGDHAGVPSYADADASGMKRVRRGGGPERQADQHRRRPMRRRGQRAMPSIIRALDAGASSDRLRIGQCLSSKSIAHPPQFAREIFRGGIALGGILGEALLDDPAAGRRNARIELGDRPSARRAAPPPACRPSCRGEMRDVPVAIS